MSECQSAEPLNQAKLLGTSWIMVSSQFPNQSNIDRYMWKCISNTCVRMHVAFKRGHIPFMPYRTTVIILLSIDHMESCRCQFDTVCVLFSVLSSFVYVYTNRKDGNAE